MTTNTRSDVPWDKFPPHAKILSQFAWYKMRHKQIKSRFIRLAHSRRKPLIMLDALERDAKILYEDAGQEFRRPIDDVLRLIERDGHFFVAQDGFATKLQCCGALLELCHADTLAYLGRDRNKLVDATMCAGGIQGYVRDGFAHNQVI